MDRLFFALGSASALVAVAAGAFGAHGLRARLSPDLLAVFETAARYQMYHALALLAVGWAVIRWPGPWPVRAGWLFAVGTLLFSGSLYALALSGMRWLGAVTPLGGLAFLAGWTCLLLGMLRR
ncbi:MAG TPA: DUF423 domain-containing protein [Gemmatimonadales bacterium]|nr:DUF423 domain-containing protein [Gemmatimonadales bacterium]HVK00647.1 DUF423 domain-containing protein [Gemmatimonadales bacterium]